MAGQAAPPGKDPDALGEDDVRRYVLHLRDTRKLAPSSINLAVHALRFFLTHTLQRDWPVLELLRVNKPLRRLQLLLAAHRSPRTTSTPRFLSPSA